MRHLDSIRILHSALLTLFFAMTPDVCSAWTGEFQLPERRAEEYRAALEYKIRGGDEYFSFRAIELYVQDPARYAPLLKMATQARKEQQLGPSPRRFSWESVADSMVGAAGSFKSPASIFLAEFGETGLDLLLDVLDERVTAYGDLGEGVSSNSLSSRMALVAKIATTDSTVRSGLNAFTQALWGFDTDDPRLLNDPGFQQYKNSSEIVVKLDEVIERLRSVEGSEEAPESTLRQEIALAIKRISDLPEQNQRSAKEWLKAQGFAVDAEETAVLRAQKELEIWDKQLPGIEGAIDGLGYLVGQLDSDWGRGFVAISKSVLHFSDLALRLEAKQFGENSLSGIASMGAVLSTALKVFSLFTSGPDPIEEIFGALKVIDQRLTTIIRQLDSLAAQIESVGELAIEIRRYQRHLAASIGKVDERVQQLQLGQIEISDALRTYFYDLAYLLVEPEALSCLELRDRLAEVTLKDRQHCLSILLARAESLPLAEFQKGGRINMKSLSDVPRNLSRPALASEQSHEAYLSRSHSIMLVAATLLGGFSGSSDIPSPIAWHRGSRDLASYLKAILDSSVKGSVAFNPDRTEAVSKAGETLASFLKEILASPEFHNLLLAEMALAGTDFVEGVFGLERNLASSSKEAKAQKPIRHCDRKDGEQPTLEFSGGFDLLATAFPDSPILTLRELKRTAIDICHRGTTLYFKERATPACPWRVDYEHEIDVFFDDKEGRHRLHRLVGRASLCDRPNVAARVPVKADNTGIRSQWPLFRNIWRDGHHQAMASWDTSFSASEPVHKSFARSARDPRSQPEISRLRLRAQDLARELTTAEIDKVVAFWSGGAFRPRREADHLGAYFDHNPYVSLVAESFREYQGLWLLYRELVFLGSYYGSNPVGCRDALERVSPERLFLFATDPERRGRPVESFLLPAMFGGGKLGSTLPLCWSQDADFELLWRQIAELRILWKKQIDWCMENEARCVPKVSPR